MCAAAWSFRCLFAAFSLRFHDDDCVAFLSFAEEGDTMRSKLVHEETVFDGFEAIPAAFAALFDGGNTGKMLVRAKM